MHTPQYSLSVCLSVYLSHCTSVSQSRNRSRVGLVAAISSNILIVCILIELIKMQILALDHDQPSRQRAGEHETRRQPETARDWESVQIACDFLSVFCMEKCENASGTKKAQHLGLARFGLADQQSTKAFFISISISSASFTFSGVQKKSADSLILPLYFVLKICTIKETNWRSFC